MEIKYYRESIITPLHRNEVIQLQHNIQILSDKNTQKTGIEFFVEFETGRATIAYATQSREVERKKRTKAVSDSNGEEFRDFPFYW